MKDLFQIAVPWVVEIMSLILTVLLLLEVPREMPVFTRMDPVQRCQTTHEWGEDENEDDPKPDDVMQHATKGHQQRAELLIGGKKVGNARETQNAGQSEKHVW